MSVEAVTPAEGRSRLNRLFAGTPRQEFWLTACCLSFFAVHAVYDLNSFFRVDLRFYAGHDVFPYRPTGLLALAWWRTLVAHPRALAFIQYGFSLSCLVAALSPRPFLIQRLVVLCLGHMYFAVLNSYVRENNIEFLAFLVLLAFAPVPRPSAGRFKTFSPACFLLWLLLALLYANSAVTHALNYDRWVASGVGLKNLFLVKLNNDLNWTPLATSELMTSLVTRLPDWVFWIMGISTLVFDATFWLCLFFRRPRLYFLAFGFAFHLMCILFMNIVFAPMFPVYVGLAFWEMFERRSQRGQSQPKVPAVSSP